MRWKVVVIVSILVFFLAMAQAATEKVLYTFTGGLDGGQPNAGVVLGPDGNLYGVTMYGGAYGQGTVFQLSFANGNWTENVLYSFTGGTDGSEPVGAVAFDDAGNLYGTALFGGDAYLQCGTVFELTPNGPDWTFTVLHTFTSGTDGCGPIGNLRQAGGILYGTTGGGGQGPRGQGNQGTVFSMTTSGGNEAVYPLLKNAGIMPTGGFLSRGFGVAYSGGRYQQGTFYGLTYCFNGACLKPYHAFESTGIAGYNPVGDLAVNGRYMVGTTSTGGAGGGGAVYEVAVGYWTPKVLHSFSGPDGSHPFAGPIIDGAGNLYGTTWVGGANNRGVVFKLTPGAKNKWGYTLLYSFTGGPDGGEVYSGLVQDSAGNLYGTTIGGGAYGQGVVYEIIQ